MASTPPSPSPSPPPLQANGPAAAAAGEGGTQSSPAAMNKRFQFCPEDGHRFAPGEKMCPVCGTLSDASEYLLSSSGTAKPQQKPHHHHQQQQQEEKQRWRKLLYIKQDFPDNFVDNTFLEAMERNGWPLPFSSRKGKKEKKEMVN